VIVGIDPGLSGAIALLNPTTREVVVHDMPLVASKAGRSETDLHNLARLLIPEGVHNIAVLEQVHAMPKQGSASTFRFGQNYGACQMAISGHGYDVRDVTPQSWKKHFRLGSDGNASRALAMQRFPAMAEELKRKKDHNRAEAILLALYGLEIIYPTYLQQ
jgi:Holliday junction resolvasome RuvABC endonuclease subunit